MRMKDVQDSFLGKRNNRLLDYEITAKVSL